MLRAMSSGRINRNELARMIAIDRAEYEIMVEESGYSESARQPMIPFVKAAATKIAKNSSRPVDGVHVARGEYGVTFTCRIDWKKMAARVERQVPGWKETIKRVDADATSE